MVSFDQPQHVELELDEMHSFVQKKAKKRWVWIALCKQTRQVVACVIGGRGAATCKQLWKGIPENYKQGLCYSDFWVTQFSVGNAYQSVLPDEHHQPVSKASGLTAHVERFNNTLRPSTGKARPVQGLVHRLARFVRKTLAFSKSEHMHLTCLHRFLVRYNLEIIRD